MASSAVAVDRHEQEQEASIDANVSILSGTTVVIDNLVEGARVRKHKGEINGYVGRTNDARLVRVHV